jgi:mannose/cellobiose epimerase-like protein (N-acyl-D-glucosamine 2-epimerase family)
LLRVLDLLVRKTAGEWSGTPVEKYTEDWRPWEDEDNAPVVSYGHLFKAAWLFLEAYRRTQNTTYLHFARNQLEHAMRFGVDPAAGVFESGTVEGDVLDARHSWWPQCEAVAALSRAWAILGADQYAPNVARLIDYSLACFHDKEFGEWYALLSPQNEVLDSRKAHERKCAYPIVRAFAAAVQDLACCEETTIS